MAWHDPLTTHLLDFLFELEKKGMKTPLTIAGGFGLFLKKHYLDDRQERTLLERKYSPRATRDIDIFVPAGILCDRQQSQSVVDTLHGNYTVVDTWLYTQWEKTIQTGDVKFDFLTGNVDAYKKSLHIRSERARNPHVEGFHARITREALFIDEKAQEIPLHGIRGNGEKYAARVRIPHPFTYLMMKVFAFYDWQNDQQKRQRDSQGLIKQKHAFDVFAIIGTLTERELNESITLGKNYIQEPTIQEAKQIVKNCFTATQPSGMDAIKKHPLFQDFEAEDYDDFLDALMDILG